MLLGYFEECEREHIKRAYAYVTEKKEKIVYYRSRAINLLEHECVNVFIENEEAILSGTFKGSLIDNIKPHIAQAYKHSSQVAVEKIYRSRDVLDIELAGYHIIYTLLELVLHATLTPDNTYSKLLLSRISSQYQLNATTLYEKVMAVIDFISGMTDVFSLDLYRKINGSQLPTV